VPINVSRSAERSKIHTRVSLANLVASLVLDRPICRFAELFEQTYYRKLRFSIGEKIFTRQALCELTDQ